MPGKKFSRNKAQTARRETIRTGPCPFCGQKTSPDYKKFDELKKYVSDRGKIIGRKRTGVCAKHQRRLGTAIKRARHLGLLPFTSGL